MNQQVTEPQPGEAQALSQHQPPHLTPSGSQAIETPPVDAGDQINANVANFVSGLNDPQHQQQPGNQQLARPKLGGSSAEEDTAAAAGEDAGGLGELGAVAEVAAL